MNVCYRTSSARSRCFQGQDEKSMGFDYTITKNARMKHAVLLQKLRRVSNTVVRNFGLAILLLVEIVSSHWRYEDLISLHNITVYLLHKRTTAILQSIDACVIAIINRRYYRRIVERRVYLIESGTVSKHVGLIDVW